MAASRVGRNHFWNTEMDKVLVDSLLEQVLEGHKIPNGFKDVAYTAASRAMNSRCDERAYQKSSQDPQKEIRGRQHYKNTPGFGWDDVNKKIEVMEDVYNAWVAVHPEHKKYFAEKHVLIDDFCHIFGEDYATGGWSRDDVAPSQEVQSSAPHIDDLGVDDTPETETISESPMVFEEEILARAYEYLNCNPTENIDMENMWNLDIDRTLLASMANQITEGNRVRDGFNNVAFTNTVIHINNAHNLNMDISHIKKRFRTLKKNYKKVKTILEQGRFFWNSTTKRVSISNEENPEVMGILTGRHDLFEESLVVFGDDYATGQWAR
ncbi:uncharacterized protein LOC143861303 [Tasmannia lanceolata]|uniref:uncharacterized protein LOC143861303 n=1 Tax=Tasmannia lanceolata TaxID=3420 RepID=UPI0040639549